MVEQNDNQSTNNDDTAPKRRTRLFGGRRARSGGPEDRSDTSTDGVETVAGDHDQTDDDAEASQSASTDVPDVSVEVETASIASDAPEDVSVLTGDLPVVPDAAEADSVGAAADAAGAAADDAGSAAGSAAPAAGSDASAAADAPAATSAAVDVTVGSDVTVISDASVGSDATIDAEADASAATEASASADAGADGSTAAAAAGDATAGTGTTADADGPANGGATAGADVTGGGSDGTTDADATAASEPFVPRATSTLSLIFHAPVLPELPSRDDRYERGGRGDRFDRGDRGDRGQRFDRSDRADRSDRGDDGDRFERADRSDRGDRGDRGDRYDRADRSDRGDRYDRTDRSDRGDRYDRADRSDRSDRTDRSDRGDRYERPERTDRNDRWDDEEREEQGTSRRRTRRRGSSSDREQAEPRRREPELITEPQRIKGSTRLEAKKQRRRDGRDAGRRRTVITEDEFLARRESVDRQMIVRSSSSTIEIGVLEDGVLAEHYVTKSENVSLIGNVYLGKVQNVLPSMEAAFVDIGRGRNAVLYAGEVDWNSVDTSHGRRIEAALKPGDKVLVQVTKDPVGHKGARLTSQISLPGRYLVYVPNGSMNGISRKLPDTERARLKKILKEVLPEQAGVIVRTAAEGATEDQLTRDVQRLTSQWDAIEKKVQSGQAPVMLHSEPDLLLKIVRDVFNEDFTKLIIDGESARETIDGYLTAVAPDLKDRVELYDGPDSFEEHRINEQVEKALDRKVWLPSGGSLVIDRTEAMTVVDVNTGKFVGSGGNLEETVTKNNLEAAEELVRQLRLRDIGGIIVVDFIDMVLEENRDLVLRRLMECLSRDRTKHQVAEVTSLGLVQMTRKKIGVGLRESLDEVNAKVNDNNADPGPSKGRRKGRSDAGGRNTGSGGSGSNGSGADHKPSQAHQITDDVKNALSRIAASTLVHDEQAERVTGIAGAVSPSSGSSVDSFGSPDTPTSPEAPEAPAESSGGSKRRRRRGSRAGDAQQPSDVVVPQAESTGSGVDVPETVVAPPVADRAPEADRAPAASREDAPKERPTGRRRVSSSAPVTPADTTVAILDIPVGVAKREPRPVSEDTESLLDSVLQALPEPKQPGQGRSRSRRVSSGSISAPAAATDTDDGTVILGS